MDYTSECMLYINICKSTVCTMGCNKINLFGGRILYGCQPSRKASSTIEGLPERIHQSGSGLMLALPHQVHKVLTPKPETKPF